MADEEDYGGDPKEADDDLQDADADAAPVVADSELLDEQADGPAQDEALPIQATSQSQAEITNEVTTEDGAEEKPKDDEEGAGETTGEVAEEVAGKASGYMAGEEAPAVEDITGQEVNAEEGEVKTEGGEEGDEIPKEEGEVENGEQPEEVQEQEVREREEVEVATAVEDTEQKEEQDQEVDEGISTEQAAGSDVGLDSLQDNQRMAQSIDTPDVLSRSKVGRRSTKLKKSLIRLSHIENTSMTIIRKASVRILGTSSGTEQTEHPFEDFEIPSRISRDQLNANMKDAKRSATILLQRNDALQFKLADHFMKRQLHAAERHSRNQIMDDDHKYYQLLDEYRTRDVEGKTILANYNEQIHRLGARSKRKQEMADLERSRLLEVMRRVALSAVSGQNGKPLAEKDVDLMISQQQSTAAEMVTVTLEYNKLRNALKKKEQELRSKDEFAEGLSLVDFDLIKIENETCNEKIEERNEELLKLRKKNASTVQVLTHIKEKLRFVQRENQVKKTALKDVEQTMSQSRIVLSRTKQARDALREDNRKLRNNSGLIGNRILLENYEYTVDKMASLRTRLGVLQKKHAEFTIQTSSIKDHINHHIQQTRTY